MGCWRMGILGVDPVIFDGDNKKVLGVLGRVLPRYLPEVQGIREFRSYPGCGWGVSLAAFGAALGGA